MIKFYPAGIHWHIKKSVLTNFLGFFNILTCKSVSVSYNI